MPAAFKNSLFAVPAHRLSRNSCQKILRKRLEWHNHDIGNSSIELGVPFWTRKRFNEFNRETLSCLFINRRLFTGNTDREQSSRCSYLFLPTYICEVVQDFAVLWSLGSSRNRPFPVEVSGNCRRFLRTHRPEDLIRVRRCRRWSSRAYNP